MWHLAPCFQARGRYHPLSVPTVPTRSQLAKNAGLSRRPLEPVRRSKSFWVARAAPPKRQPERSDGGSLVLRLRVPLFPRVNNWWSPNWYGLGTQSDAVELTAKYEFAGKLWNFFSPTVDGKVGWQLYEKEDLVPDYTYWDVGLRLGFLGSWEADIRYYDTDYSKTGCAINSDGRDNCDARVVGAIKAKFPHD